MLYIVVEMTIEEALRIVAENKEEIRKMKKREYMREYQRRYKEKINEQRRIRRQNVKTPKPDPVV